MKEFKAARKKDLNMMSSPKSRKRKMKKPPQPPRAAKARPKTIEVDEEHDSLDFGYIVQQLLTGDGSESISDHPSSSTSSNRREESVPVGSLSEPHFSAAGFSKRFHIAAAATVARRRSEYLRLWRLGRAGSAIPFS